MAVRDVRCASCLSGDVDEGWTFCTACAEREIAAELAALRAEVEKSRQELICQLGESARANNQIKTLELAEHVWRADNDRLRRQVHELDEWVNRLKGLLRERVEMEHKRWAASLTGAMKCHDAGREWLQRVVKELEAKP